MDENDLFEAFNESPVVKSEPTEQKQGKKLPQNPLWDKTDFKATPIEPGKFSKSGRTFTVYSFVPFDKQIEDEVLVRFTKIANHLASKGYIFRYCGSSRDDASNTILKLENIEKETYLGFPGCNKDISKPTMKGPTELGYSTSMAYNAGFLKQKPALRAITASRVHSMFGKDVNNPVDLVIVYNSTGDVKFSKDTDWKNVGDINFYFKLAKDGAIPFFNIGNEESKKALMEFLNTL